MVHSTIDITEWELAMHIGAYARESGVNRVADWLKQEKSRLIKELGREPLRHELAHALKNVNYADMFARELYGKQ